MEIIINLNGDDWSVSGWWKNQWRFVQSMEINEMLPPAVQSIPAKVPGAIQADLLRARIIDDFNYGLDSVKCEWVNNREWIYEKYFTIPSDIDEEKYILCFDGLDYSGEIYLNGIKIKEFHGMFLPVEIDITAIVKFDAQNFLKVVFFISPEVDGQFGYTNRIKLIKSRFNYIWDWCPRIVPVGIWKDAYIKTFDRVRIIDCFPGTKVDVNRSMAEINVNIYVDVSTAAEYNILFNIYYNDEVVLQKTELHCLRAVEQCVETRIILEDIKLWWPNGMGEQAVYRFEVCISASDGRECDKTIKNIGFRTVEFIKNDASPDDALSYTAVINGHKVFLKGVNWVPVSPLYGTVGKNQYFNYIKRFKDMNCNILRVWGGAILETEVFFDICDSMGLMVWQEFPQSSSGLNNTPNDDSEYLKDLEKVASHYIKSVRHHPCHIIWCGGNELMWEDYVPVNTWHSNIKMLEELTVRMDPGKYFLPSSASGKRFCASENEFGKGLHHDVHGPWKYIGEGAHYRFFNYDDSLFRSETGCPAASRIDTLEKYKGDYSIWPPDAKNQYWTHRGAWWIQWHELSELCGDWKEKELDNYIKISRFLQAESLRYACEASIRRAYNCSGFIVWMGNEPFPNNANTSVVEFDGTPKPAYYWLGNAFSRIHASAAYSKIHYTSGEQFEADIYISSQDFKSLYPVDNSNWAFKNIKADIFDLKGRTMFESEWKVALSTGTSSVDRIEWKVEDCEYNLFILRLLLREDDAIIDENYYIFTVNSEQAFKPLKRLPQCQLDFKKCDDSCEKWIVANYSNIAALGVFVCGKEPESFLNIFPNYFVLMPGEEKILEVKGSMCLVEEDSLTIETLN